MPSYTGLHPASRTASERARASSKKSGTRCEVALARALRRLRLSPAVCPRSLPGRPDLVFARPKVAVFCDGDFWHGRGLKARLERLSAGHNAGYWVEKIRANVARDRRNRRLLRADGWTVLRFWETDILRDPRLIATRIARLLRPAPAPTSSPPCRGRGRSARTGRGGGGGAPARASPRGAPGSSR